MLTIIQKERIQTLLKSPPYSHRVNALKKHLRLSYAEQKQGEVTRLMIREIRPERQEASQLRKHQNNCVQNAAAEESIGHNRCRSFQEPILPAAGAVTIHTMKDAQVILPEVTKAIIKKTRSWWMKKACSHRNTDSPDVNYKTVHPVCS